MKKLTISALLSLIFLSASANAYFTFGESGEILAENDLRIGFEPQFRLSEGSGQNFTAYFDKRYNQDSQIRFHLGAGNTDFYSGLSWKWIPIPDYDTQPALGVKVEGIYARDESVNVMSLRLMPMASKKMESEYGLFVPYAALAFSLNSSKDKTEASTQLVVGSEFSSQEIQHWGFGGEIGLNLSKAFSHLAFFATYTFDETKGIEPKTE